MEFYANIRSYYRHQTSTKVYISGNFFFFFLTEEAKSDAAVHPHIVIEEYAFQKLI